MVREPRDLDLVGRPGLTRIGLDVPIIGPIFNRLVLPLLYSRRNAEQWIIHNIEETGRSEDVIPPIYGHHRVEAG